MRTLALAFAVLTSVSAFALDYQSQGCIDYSSIKVCVGTKVVQFKADYFEVVAIQPEQRLVILKGEHGEVITDVDADHLSLIYP